MTVEVQPYFAEGERYPVLIGVRAEGDEYETAYVSKSELANALTENTRLREYAKLMHDHIKECCDCCDELYCSEWDEDNECCRFDTMMRACGIEVPS